MRVSSFRAFTLRLCLAVLWFCGLGVTLPAEAQGQVDPERTTAEEARVVAADSSVIGAEVVPRGDVALSAGLGWPGFFGELKLGISARADIGFRGSVFYGAPLLGFETSTGGALSIPVRVTLREQSLSILFVAVPFAVIGESTLVGGEARFGDSLGYALGADLEIRASGRVGNSTLMFGVSSMFAWRQIRDADASGPVVTAQALLGAEARMTNETRLFIEVGAGYALYAPGYIGSAAVARVALGVVYLL